MRAEPCLIVPRTPFPKGSLWDGDNGKLRIDNCLNSIFQAPNSKCAGQSISTNQQLNKSTSQQNYNRIEGISSQKRTKRVYLEINCYNDDNCNSLYYHRGSKNCSLDWGNRICGQNIYLLFARETLAGNSTRKSANNFWKKK